MNTPLFNSVKEIIIQARQFYKAFPICDTLLHELNRSHYRLLCRLDSEKKVQYYLTAPKKTKPLLNTLFWPITTICLPANICFFLPAEEELKQLIDEDRARFEK